MGAIQKSLGIATQLFVTIFWLCVLGLWIELHQSLSAAGHTSIWSIGLRYPHQPTDRAVTWTAAIIAAAGWGTLARLQVTNSSELKRVNLPLAIRRTVIVSAISIPVLMIPDVIRVVSYPPLLNRLTIFPGSLLWLPVSVGWITLTLSSCVAAVSVICQRPNPAPGQALLNVFIACGLALTCVGLLFAASDARIGRYY